MVLHAQRRSLPPVLPPPGFLFRAPARAERLGRFLDSARGGGSYSSRRLPAQRAAATARGGAPHLRPTRALVSWWRGSEAASGRGCGSFRTLAPRVGGSGCFVPEPLGCTECEIQECKFGDVSCSFPLQFFCFSLTRAYLLPYPQVTLLCWSAISASIPGLEDTLFPTLILSLPTLPPSATPASWIPALCPFSTAGPGQSLDAWG